MNNTHVRPEVVGKHNAPSPNIYPLTGLSLNSSTVPSILPIPAPSDIPSKNPSKKHSAPIPIPTSTPTNASSINKLHSHHSPHVTYEDKQVVRYSKYSNHLVYSYKNYSTTIASTSPPCGC